MKFIYFVALMLFSIFSYAKENALHVLWETKGLRVPESVLVVGKGKDAYLLVSEIEGAGNALDGNGGIAKLSLDGKVITHDWVRGLNAPKGMAVFNGKLIVSDIHDVVIIDIASAKVEKRIAVTDSVFLNDVAVDGRGIIYVSDTRTKIVHRIKGSKADIYLDNIEGANGLTFVNDVLYVAGGDSLWQVGADKKLKLIAKGFEENADGLEMIRPNEFIVSCWAGITYYVKKGQLQVLLDTRAQSKNTADIGWNKKHKTVYVPTFKGNSVVAYKLK